MRHDFVAEHTARAGTIVDHKRLPHHLGQPRDREPRNDVGAAARGERHYHAYRAFRVTYDIGWRLCVSMCHSKYGAHCYQSNQKCL